MGLAIAAEHESTTATASACYELTRGTSGNKPLHTRLRIIDLSALWAGPLASHLLWQAGAEVIKVESRTRPDAMRDGDQTFYALLNQGKASVALNFADHNDRQVLLALIADADVVIEAARPRALLQLGIDASQIVRTQPGLIWLTITGHGATGDSANAVGFGDDCGVAGGLSAALREASGHSGFVGDAIADPLTGIYAATIAWRAWQSQRGGRFGIAMSRVVAAALAAARTSNEAQLNHSLKAWHQAQGQSFPSVRQRAITSVRDFGQDTHAYVACTNPC
jgi:crotonobetainyl-CoA:carnitine CoA-transferase CaiB-like acyl-CoA transferase